MMEPSGAGVRSHRGTDRKAMEFAGSIAERSSWFV